MHDASVIAAWVSKLFAAYGPAPDRIRSTTYVEMLADCDPDDVRTAVDIAIRRGGTFPCSAGDLQSITRDVARKRREAATLALPHSEPAPTRENPDEREAWRERSIAFRESHGLNVPDWLRESNLETLRLAPDRAHADVPKLRECPFARATREVRPDDLDTGYRAEEGIGARCRRMLDARQRAYEDAGNDTTDSWWAALNDLSLDATLGEHVRRMRAAAVTAARHNAGVA